MDFLSGRRVLYIVSLHTFCSSYRQINFAMNVNWTDEPSEVKHYITNLVKDVASGQHCFLRPYDQCVYITSILVPTFMNKALYYNKPLLKKKFSVIVPFDILVSDDNLDDTKLAIKVYNDLIKQASYFDCKYFFNDIRFLSDCNIHKCLYDLGLSPVYKDRSTRYSWILERETKSLLVRSEKYDIKHDELKTIKRYCKFRNTIKDKMIHWAIRAKNRVLMMRHNLKVNLNRLKRSPPKRVAPIIDKKTGVVIKRNRGRYRNYKWSAKRNNLILQTITYTNSFTTISKRVIKCVDADWITRKERGKRGERFRRIRNFNSITMKNECVQADYEAAVERMKMIKPHLMGLISDIKLKELLIMPISDFNEALSEVKRDWLMMFL